MPNGRTTLLDVAKLNGADKEVGLIEEVATSAPEAEIFPFRLISGLSYPTVTRTSLPSVGFRFANQGVTATKSAFIRKLVEAYIFGGRVEADKAVAMAYDEGMEAWEMVEALGVFKQSLISLGSQIWYGVGADAKGFPGIKSALPFTAGVADGSVINVAGTTASTASSVYAVKFGKQDVTLVGGNNAVPTLGDFRDETIYDANAAPLPGRVADLIGWIGLQIGNVNCVRRLANVTADSGKTLNGTFLARLVNSFPIGFRPDAIFMSRRSREQYQLSMTVVLNGGAGGDPNGMQTNVAPMPTHYDNIPIIATDSILNTDAIEA
jgi:hypothetical protein